MRRLQSLALRVAYWLCVVALCGLVTEASVRVWGLSPTYSLQSKGIPYSLRFVLNPELLFSFVPDPAHAINARGFRDVEFPAKKAGSPRVLVIGDSFPMGLVVPPDETFPKQLGQLLPGLEVLNLGVQGYGPDQELKILRLLAKRLNADGIVWCLFPSNDYNDLIKNNLFTLSSDGRLVDLSPNAVTSALPLLRTQMLFRFLLTGHFLNPEIEERLHALFFVDHEAPTPVSADTKRLMKAIIAEFKEAASALNIPLVAVVLPSYEQAQPSSQVSQELNADTAQMLREQGIRTVDLSTAFENSPLLYTEEEHHLSQAGHLAVANALRAEVARMRP